jgi:hypothetical protein
MAKKKNKISKVEKEEIQKPGYRPLIIFLAIIVVAIFLIQFFSPQEDYNYLADCLSEKGVIMVGTDSCPACRAQKEKFGEAFSKINYKNCDLDVSWCNANNIQGYPTWVFPDNTQALGVKSYQFLFDTAGCEPKA